jgi:DNA-binding NarL/FixJ family response regulator
MLSVVLVDDHLALRDGLRVLLERRGVEVRDAVGTATEALASLRRHRPDIAVIDLQLADQSGLSLAREIRADPIEVKILIYTGSQDPQTLTDALQVGADGIVLKPGGLGSLLEALRAVDRGERHVDPALAEILRAAEGSEHLLTPRERQVFALLAEGLSGEEAAERLVLSAETVRTHVRNGMGKLQARTRTEAVVRALEAGEIELDG